jgi:hypothetical protein
MHPPATEGATATADPSPCPSTRGPLSGSNLPALGPYKAGSRCETQGQMASTQSLGTATWDKEKYSSVSRVRQVLCDQVNMCIPRGLTPGPVPVAGHYSSGCIMLDHHGGMLSTGAAAEVCLTTITTTTVTTTTATTATQGQVRTQYVCACGTQGMPAAHFRLMQ